MRNREFTALEIERPSLYMPMQDGTKYAEMFAKMDTEDGYLSGKRAGGLLRKSGLPREVLARVWALSDEDSDGRLSFEVSKE